MAGALEKYTCSRCTSTQQRAWGCEEEVRHPVHIINGKPVYRCPVTLLTTFTRRMMTLNVHYKNGYLPYRGGIMEQPAYYYQAMQVLEMEVGKAQKNLQNKEAARAKAKAAARANAQRGWRGM